MNAESLKKSILQWAIEGKLVLQLDTEPDVEQIGEKPQESPFEIPNKWKWVRLKNVGKIVGGGTPKTNVSKYWDNGTILWITPADLGKVHDLYVSESSRKITEIGLRESSAVMLPKNTVLFSSRAPIGHIALAAENCCTNQGCKSFVPNEKHIDPLWGYYVMKGRTADMIARASGTTFREISGKGVGDTWIPLPPLQEQQRIVGKLAELLPLVDVYGREQEALERLEKALPGKLRASILQEAIQGKLVPQIDEEPSVKQIGEPPEEVPFVIPEKWKWVQLKNLVDVTKQKIPDKDFLYLDVSGVAPNKKSIQSLSAIKANDAPSRARKIVKEGMVLFSTVRPYFLKTVVAENLDLEKETIASTAFSIFSCKNELLNKFIWLVLQSPYFLEYVTSCQKGSTYPAITDKLFYSAYVPLPPVEEQRRIVQKVIELLGEVEKLS